MARNTIKRTLTPLRLALDYAVDEEKIGSNPAAGLKLPKEAPTRKLHVPTLAEVKTDSGQCDPGRPGRDHLVAALGLRRGEMLALRWSDVDLGRGLVHVRRQNLRGLIVEETKTEAGVRTVPLYASARAMLEARAERQNLTLKWLAQDERLIFPNALGGPFEPTELESAGVGACAEGRRPYRRSPPRPAPLRSERATGAGDGQQDAIRCDRPLRREGHGHALQRTSEPTTSSRPPQRTTRWARPPSARSRPVRADRVDYYLAVDAAQRVTGPIASTRPKRA